MTRPVISVVGISFVALSVVALCSAGSAGPACGVTWFVAPAESLRSTPGPLADVDGSRERPFRDLAATLRRAEAWSLDPATVESITVQLAPGIYDLTPVASIEPTCGNCETPLTAVPHTYALLLRGRRLNLVGAPGHASILRTHAGYGLWVKDCEECSVRDLVVSDGVRDTSGLATDAAIVVQRSSLAIEQCLLTDNIGDPDVVGRTVVGIMGICGREGSVIRVVGNRITRNSWDGIALYRGAQAEIVDNVIDGVDLAVGGRVGGGRGVGIGCTWDARAIVRGNLVRRYWKGIGFFVDAQGEVTDNVVTEMATWGLSIWDAGRGRARTEFTWNAVDSTGACGLSLASAAGGVVDDNAFVRTGQNPKYDSGEPYCHQAPIALHTAASDPAPERNLFFANRSATPHPFDLPEATFRQRVQPLCRRLAQYTATRESAFQRHWAD